MGSLTAEVPHDQAKAFQERCAAGAVSAPGKRMCQQAVAHAAPQLLGSTCICVKQQKWQHGRQCMVGLMHR
jgi:hypothetical protein